jgi:O-antigen/teichoic acid export membrane protein
MPAQADQKKNNALKTFFHTAVKSEFARNVLTLLTGTALGQGIALLLSPLITRLFGPTDFATYEQYFMLLSILSVVVTGKYEFAIMHPEQQEDARHVAALAARTAFFSCLLLLLIALFFSGSISAIAHNPELGMWLWTLPFAVFFLALFNIINYWFSRKKEYTVAATSKLIYSASGEPVKLFFGYAGAGVGGLITGTILGNFTAAIYSWFKFRVSEPQTFRNLSSEKTRILAREHKGYPQYAVPAAVLNNLAQWAHVAVFIYFYGEKALVPIGLIALSRRIFFNPLGILSTSYGQVFYQRISEISDAAELRSYYTRIFFRFLLFSASLVAIVQMLPENTIGFIFGAAWKDALIYLQILSYWYALNFVIGTLSFVIYRLGKQWYKLAIDAFHFVIVILAFWFARSNDYNEFEAVKAMVWAKVIYLVINAVIVFYFLNSNCKIVKSK